MSSLQKQYWNERFKENADYTPLNEIFFDTMVYPLLHLSSQPECFDISCGSGQALELLASRGFIIDGCDISSVALQKASDRLQGKSRELLEIDLNDENFTFPNKTYDLVLLKLVFAFVDTDKRISVLKKICDLLKEDGTFLIISPVTYADVVYRNPKIEKISVNEDELFSSLQEVFGIVQKIHTDFQQEQWALAYFLCKK